MQAWTEPPCAMAAGPQTRPSATPDEVGVVEAHKSVHGTQVLAAGVDLFGRLQVDIDLDLGAAGRRGVKSER